MITPRTGTWPVAPRTPSTNIDVSTGAATPGTASSRPDSTIRRIALRDDATIAPSVPRRPMFSRARFSTLSVGWKNRAISLKFRLNSAKVSFSSPPVGLLM